MSPEYQEIIDKYNLTQGTTPDSNNCYYWNGYWILSYYNGKYNNFVEWALMSKINIKYIDSFPFYMLETCRKYTPEELDKGIANLLFKYKQAKVNVKLKNLKKDFKCVNQRYNF